MKITNMNTKANIEYNDHHSRLLACSAMVSTPSPKPIARWNQIWSDMVCENDLMTLIRKFRFRVLEPSRKNEHVFRICWLVLLDLETPPLQSRKLKINKKNPSLPCPSASPDLCSGRFPRCFSSNVSLGLKGPIWKPKEHASTFDTPKRRHKSHSPQKGFVRCQHD